MTADLAKAKSDHIVEYKSMISEEIEKEICTRFFLENGMIEAGFDDDKDLMKAIEILNSPVQYAKILGAN